MVNKAQLWLGIKRRVRNRRFWRDSGLLVLANVVGIGLGLIRTPALTWLLPKDEVGMIGVVVSWQAVLVFLTWPSSLSAASYHYVAKGQLAAFTVMLNQQLRRSWLSVLGFLMSAVYWWWQGELTLAVLFVVGGIAYPTTIVFAASGGMLAAQENFMGLFWFRVGQNISSFAGFVPLLLSVWWVSRVIMFYATNQVVLSLLLVGFTAWLLWQLRRSQIPAMTTDEKNEMMLYGKHLTGIHSFGAIQSRADQLIVSAFLPLTTMADYTIAVLVNAQLKRLWTTYVTLRYPPFVRLPVALRLRRMWIEGAIVWLGFVGLGVAVSVLAQLLVPILLPPSYAGSLAYIKWTIAALVIIIPGAFAEIFFRTEQDTKRQYFMRITASTLAVVFPLILVFDWGVYGVLFGRFLANLVFSLLGIFLLLQKK